MVVVVQELGQSLRSSHIPLPAYAEPRPICVAKHLSPFLPSHPIVSCGGEHAIDAVSAAPFGSASILLISWAYIRMLGGQGLTDSSKIALLNANYMAHRLAGHYTLRYKNDNGRVAHELLIDLAEFEKSAGLKVMDFAKRLQVRPSIHSVWICGDYLSYNLLIGLRLPSTNLFLAHLNMHVD